MKARETRVSGINGDNGKEKVNDEIYEFLSDSSFSDEEIMSTFGISESQLRARRSVMKRRKREEKGEISFNELKEIVMERDRYSCQYPNCGMSNEEHIKRDRTSLHVHHIDYNHENNVLRNAISLCSTHHGCAHSVPGADEVKLTLEKKVYELNTVFQDPVFNIIFGNLVLENYTGLVEVA